MRSSKSAPDPLLAGSAGFAHRGLHGAGIAENSMAAFRAALAADVGIECDLRLSCDGQAMVFHDDSLERLCGVDIEPESLHASALMRFRLAGSAEGIAWLGELLALVGGRVPLLLELKRRSRSRASAAPIACLGRATQLALQDYRGPVAVMSFDANVGSWFAAHAPLVRRGLVLDGRDSLLVRTAKLWWSRANFVAIKADRVDAPWVARLRRSGRNICCWTIRSAAERKSAMVHADALIWEADGRP